MSKMMERRQFLKYLAGISFALAVPKSNIFTEIRNPGLEARLLLAYNEIDAKFKLNDGEPALIVDGQNQKLYLADGYNGFRINEEYNISTARKGFGNKPGSNKTPLGIHRIKEKFGGGANAGTVFVNRINTGRIAKPNSKGLYAARDSITSRIMWLEGCEKQNQSTYSRCVYIHGVPHKRIIEKPASRGCILMTNNDIIQLDNLVNAGTYVNIKEHI